MKVPTTITTIKRLTVLTAVFAPFFMAGFALFVVPDPWQTLRNTNGVDWIWLILLGGMMVGVYYFLAVYLEDEEEIAEEFQRLDGDRDGFISREDAKDWPDLIRLFDRFDTDRDGRLSHVDFEAFENAVPGRVFGH